MADRWYDKFPKISKSLEKLKGLEEPKRTYVINNIVQIIKEKNPELLDPEKALNFPLDLRKRRWYDKDPYFWLLVNTLREAGPEVIKSVGEYFTLEISALLDEQRGK